MKRTPLKRTYWIRKKRKPLNYVSTKARKRAAKSSGLRRKLVNESGECMACGHSSRNPIPGMPLQMSKLACHEIYRGSSGRQLSLDKKFALLVLCWRCNSIEFDDLVKWPQARQLCLLQVRRPDLYNLAKFNHLVNPRAPERITQAEVDAWLPSMLELI